MIANFKKEVLNNKKVFINGDESLTEKGVHS